MINKTYCALALAMLVVAPQASASIFGPTKAPLEVVVQAQHQRASELTRIAVFDFTGQDGVSFSNALRDQLSSARVRGEPTKTLLTSQMLQPSEQTIPKILEAGKQMDVEAIYHGSVDVVNWETTRTTEERNVCTKIRNKYFGSCEEGYMKKQNVRCDIITGHYQATLTILAVPSGDTVYTRQIPKSQSFKYCQGDKGALPGGGAVAASARTDVLAEFVGDLIPRTETIKVELKKSGRIDKNDSKVFKDAIKAAKAGRWDKACGRWGAMEEKYDTNIGLVYNLGLCAEYLGDLDRALTLYQKADSLVIDDDAINAAISRVNGARSVANLGM
ncbi:MAG: tetratricopeptide repeat protein [Pseudomonadota bacterium]